MSEVEIIKVEELAPPDFELPKLDKLKGKTIFITEFLIDVSKFGEYAVITTKRQGKYITSSEIVIKQLKRIINQLAKDEKLLGKDVMVEATIQAIKTDEGEYYILTSKKSKK